MRENRVRTSWIRAVRRYTSSLADLLVVLAYVAVADAALLDNALSPTVRALIGFPLLLFVPGYILLAGLFPRGHRPRRTDDDQRLFGAVSEGALRPLERAVLSFGISVALLPPAGLVLSGLGVGFRPETVVGAASAAFLAGIVVACARRLRVPESERVSVPVTGWLSRATAGLSGDSQVEATTAFVVVLVALVATSALAYGLVAPGGGDSYTTMAMYSENDTGALVTSDYPDSLAANETGDVVVVVENHEHRQVNYTLVAELQRVDRSNGTVTVLEAVELNQSQQSLVAGERWRSNQTIRPELTGDDLRVVYLLYRNPPPADPGIESAYRNLYFTIDVAE